MRLRTGEVVLSRVEVQFRNVGNFGRVHDADNLRITISTLTSKDMS